MQYDESRLLYANRKIQFICRKLIANILLSIYHFFFYYYLLQLHFKRWIPCIIFKMHQNFAKSKVLMSLTNIHIYIRIYEWKSKRPEAIVINSFWTRTTFNSKNITVRLFNMYMLIRWRYFISIGLFEHAH